jgi:non-ribosomal peptide synthetase component F
MLDRSAAAVIAVLPVWKAGAPYVPLDIHSPAPRLGMILADSAARLVLTHQEFVTQLGNVSIPVVPLDAERASIETLPGLSPMTVLGFLRVPMGW